jgi:hypothetical protein
LLWSARVNGLDCFRARQAFSQDPNDFTLRVHSKLHQTVSGNCTNFDIFNQSVSELL